MIGILVYLLFIIFVNFVILDYGIEVNNYGNENIKPEFICASLLLWITFAGIYCIGMEIF